MLTAIVQSVFRPASFVQNPKGQALIHRHGWLLIVVRWLYYSILFLFRDYHGRWAPFVPTPFGLDMDTYASLQRALALPFGLVLMLALGLSLAAYLRFIKKSVPVVTVLNILGPTFFLPFVIVQPIDQVIIVLWGWHIVPVSIAHTAVLVWESWATMEIISSMTALRGSQKVAGIAVLSAAWMLVTAPVWR
jgi:hypothetical protein